MKLVNKKKRWERIGPLKMSKKGFQKRAGTVASYTVHGLSESRAGYQPLGLPRWLSDKEFASQCRRPKRCRFNPWVGKIPWRKKWNPLQYQPLARTVGRLLELFLIGIASWGCR